jgi:hypothetical protein
MRLSRFLASAVLITSFAVLYVYQQMEIVRLAYTAQKKQSVFQELLDENNRLRYNIEKGISLINLGSRISGNADFQMPETYRLVKVVRREKLAKANVRSPRQESFLSRIFSVKQQAEAGVITR